MALMSSSGDVGKPSHAFMQPGRKSVSSETTASCYFEVRSNLLLSGWGVLLFALLGSPGQNKGLNALGKILLVRRHLRGKPRTSYSGVAGPSTPIRMTGRRYANGLDLDHSA